MDALPDFRILQPAFRLGDRDVLDSGTISVTGNYSTIPETHGGKKYRGAAASVAAPRR